MDTVASSVDVAHKLLKQKARKEKQLIQIFEPQLNLFASGPQGQDPSHAPAQTLGRYILDLTFD